MDGGKSMNDETKTKLPRKRWKRALKWTIGVVLIALLVWFEIAYWTSTNDCQLYSAAPTNPMKAVVYCNYGVPNLKFQEIEKPTPADDQLLIKVRAASVNPLDWHFIEGTPYFMRAMGVGLRKPKDTRLGVDFAGTVEAVGKNVTKFKPGDEVFGGRTGAFGEYVCVREARAVATKPASVTFEQAASVPIAGITALQGLRDKGKVQPGQKVLINGASGGVGTFAVQIAKSMGAAVEGRWLGPGLTHALKAMFLSKFVSQKMGMMLAELNQKDLTALADLMQSGKVTPVIDRTYTLSELPQAIEYLEQGHARGKVVVKVD